MIRLIFIAALLLAANAAGLNIAFSRIDRAQLTADTARAETRLLRAQLEQHAIAESLRATANHVPKSTELVDRCLARTEALRSAIFALVRTGNVSMPGDPGGAWAMWPQTLEARR